MFIRTPSPKAGISTPNSKSTGAQAAPKQDKDSPSTNATVSSNNTYVPGKLPTLTNIREWFRVRMPEVGLVQDATGAYHLAKTDTPRSEGSSGSSNESKNSDRNGDYFVGSLKGEKIHLKGVNVEEIIYTKRLPEETAKLRKEFNSSIRKNFLKEFANDPRRIEYLKGAGLGENDIARMKDGLNPKGWQVHHNLPLDDGGTNDYNNLVLIKNDPYHKAITNEQNSLTRGLAPKQSKKIDWPMFDGDLYPSKTFK
ncbi:HNH endonuclease signature motif containing protein [Oceanobacillus iheyensis]|uniref:HNH endonuclease signature motif containing protein n=1 Tax=Oceanobacillus iheyensis TaxID=182710 RepID=UPI00362B8D35